MREVLSSLELFNTAVAPERKTVGDFASVEDYGATMQWLQPAHLFRAAIFHKHICNFTPDQILSDIENYGNLRELPLNSS